MDNRLFKPKVSEENSDRVGQAGRLDSIQHMIKVPISIWIEQSPTRIKLLRKAVDNSFNPEMEGYQQLLTPIKNMLQDPQRFLRTVRTDNYEETMKYLVTEASDVAIAEYLNTHPEYEEILNKEEAEEEELLKKTSQSNEKKLDKNSETVSGMNEADHYSTDVTPRPFSSKVR
jgi:hypothetical protein